MPGAAKQEIQICLRVTFNRRRLQRLVCTHRLCAENIGLTSGADTANLVLSQLQEDGATTSRIQRHGASLLINQSERFMTTAVTDFP